MAENLSLDLQMEGLEEVKRRLRDPSLVMRAMRGVGLRAARAGKRTAIKSIDGGTGIATRSIVSLVFPAEGLAMVKSMMPRARALSIEEGRPPGDPPPLEAVIRWVEAMGIRRNAREIRSEIEARGAKGKRYLAQTRDLWETNLPVWLQKAARQVEAWWEKRQLKNRK